jgi:hypothetical protein
LKASVDGSSRSFLSSTRKGSLAMVCASQGRREP